MTTDVGTLLRRSRERRGLSRNTLATAIGYTNHNKGARRIDALERHGSRTYDDPLVQRLITHLSIDPYALLAAMVADARRRLAEHREALAAYDRAPFDGPRAWARIAGIPVGLPIPDAHRRSADTAVRWARRWAEDHAPLRICVLVTPHKAVWIGPGGDRDFTSEVPSGPPSLPAASIGWP